MQQHPVVISPLVWAVDWAPRTLSHGEGGRDCIAWRVKGLLGAAERGFAALPPPIEMGGIRAVLS